MNQTTKYEYGSPDKFLATLKRAKEGGLHYIWSGELKRSPFLRECLSYAEENKILKLKFRESHQESGYSIEWLESDKL